MNARLIIVLLALTACSSDAEWLAEDARIDGNRLFDAGRYARAAEAFGRAPHDPRNLHNRGIAHRYDGQWAEALNDLRQAAELATDSAIRARALHDLAHGLVGQSQWADSMRLLHGDVLAQIRIDGDDIARKLELYLLRDSLRSETKRLAQLADSSLTAGAETYKRTLRLDPQDEDARHDLALVKRLIAQRPKPEKGDGDGSGDDDKKELGEKAKLLIEQADQLVEEHRFKEALRLLQEGLQQDPTLEQRREYMDKLETVDRAAQAS